MISRASTPWHLDECPLIVEPETRAIELEADDVALRIIGRDWDFRLHKFHASSNALNFFPLFGPGGRGASNGNW
jgi:hypothetical protein